MEQCGKELDLDKWEENEGQAPIPTNLSRPVKQLMGGVDIYGKWSEGPGSNTVLGGVGKGATGLYEVITSQAA